MVIWFALHFDLREEVGADREQHRGETTEDCEVGRNAEREIVGERAAQAIDAVAERVKPHGEPL